MDKDIQNISEITKINIDDIYVINEDDRMYWIEGSLDQNILNDLEEAGYLIDVDTCPFGLSSSDDCMKVGIDAHCIIYR